MLLFAIRVTPRYTSYSLVISSGVPFRHRHNVLVVGGPVHNAPGASHKVNPALYENVGSSEVDTDFYITELKLFNTEHEKNFAR